VSIVYIELASKLREPTRP